ncbi:MAG: TIGR04551 family protein [Deltaproteobacteria bacterium]|nr:TIGR04551 family protein [Deltaproteobacteria bacterium]
MPPPASEEEVPEVVREPSPVDVEKLRLQLKEELKAELKQEMKADLEALAKDASSQRAAETEWEEERWIEEVRPKLNFLELNGYFRTRIDYMHGFDLGTYDPLIGRGTSSFSTPTMYRPFDGLPGCEENGTPDGPEGDEDRYLGQICSGTDEDTQSIVSMNMRMRLEPTLNISEDIRIKSTLDIFDNLVMGSTPESKPGFANNPTLPLPFFAASQLPVEAGFNSIFDAIRVKRLWAEIMTPIGQLRIGRQPNHWGLGLLANGGDSLDNDYGDNADQILFATRVAGHYIVPAYSISSSGANARGGGVGAGGDGNFRFLQGEQGQRYNLDPRDDVHTFILTIVKKDKEEDIKETLKNGGMVLNYGMFGVFRHQTFDVPNYYTSTNPADVPSIEDYVKRNANAAIVSFWGRFQWDKLRVEAEAVGIFGKIDGTSTSSDGLDSAPGYLRYARPNALPFWQDETFCTDDSCNAPLLVFQGGFALESSYSFLNDSLVIGVNAGVASGDDANGWGLRSVLNAEPKAGDFDGRQYGVCYGEMVTAADGSLICEDAHFEDGSTMLDNSVTNFKFDPDYAIDLILFREVLGTVTNAAYLKPHVSYYLTDTIGVRGDAIYSHALLGEGTTGQSDLSGSDSFGLANPMGLELDGTVFYGSDDGFYLMGQAGVLFPFSALSHARDPDDRDQGRSFENNTRVDPQFLDAQIAYTFQLFAGVQF